MRLRSFTSLGAIAVIAACGGRGSSAPVNAGPLGHAFEASAQANGVPSDLMIAIAEVEGGLTLPATRDVDPNANVPAAGPLMLRHAKLDTLARGAALMHSSELDLRRDSDLALEAGARVLAEVGARNGATSDLASWEPALEEMSGYADAPHRAHYAHRVLALLASGGTFPARGGESISIAPHDVPAGLTIDLSSSVRIEAAGTPEYPGAEWFPTDCTNKCDTTRGGNDVSIIVIHDTEGGWDASVATLQNDSGKSVQYIVGTDGHIGQFVPESYTAWHAGNYWVNQRSVGIEHVGYSTQPYPEAQYAASAGLVGYLAGKYNVAKDRAHVIGHDQVPNGNLISESAAPCSDSPSACEASSDYGGAGNHRDPGVWEWATYMVRFGGAAKCDDVWSLWNCNHDHDQAFRCQNGVVEVETCDGAGACVTEPNGTDDVCNKAPVSSGGGDAGSSSSGGGSDAGSIGAGGGSGSQVPPPITPAPGAATSATPSATSAPQDSASSSGGCSAAPHGRTSGDALAIAMGLGIVVVMRKRKRSLTKDR